VAGARTAPKQRRGRSPAERLPFVSWVRKCRYRPRANECGRQKPPRYALGLPSSISTRAALWAVASTIAGACATPPEDSVIGGLPCDSAGRCASGYTCVDGKCLTSGAQSAAGGGPSSGGGAHDASARHENTGGAISAGGHESGGRGDAAPGGAGTSGAAGDSSVATGGFGGSSGGADSGAGATSGVGGTSGAGGSAGTGGAGGVIGAGGAGGVVGSGGAGGVVGAGGTGGSAIGVYCSGTVCDPGASCCSDTTSSNATCAGGGCNIGVTRIECDGPEDCSGGEMCCRDSGTGTARYSCQVCGAGTVPVGCAGPQNCPAPKVCCETTFGSFPPRAINTACVDTCTGLNHNVMCRTSADCPQTTPNCQPAGALPGFYRCF
jgi:hypothetical protein